MKMKNVLEYLENTAYLKKDETAVIFEDETASWQEVLRRSKQMGTSIARLGNRGKPVAVLAEKSIDTLCVFFGAVYAGRFYIPLNPQLPAERLKSIIDTLKCGCLVSAESNIDLGKSLCENVYSFESLKNDIDEELLNAIRSKAIDSDPLYALFTSGSTGVPKGVLVSHRNVIDFIDCFTETFNINENDVIANQAPFDFDVSVKDIYSSIKTGAKIVLLPRALFSNPVSLTECLWKNKVTILIWAVSALCLITTFHCLQYKRPEHIRKIMFSGEVMPLKHLKEWMECYPEGMFVNLYGPTEITCNCTYHIIDKEREYQGAVPIGRAFENREVFLLNGKNELLTEESSETGEICVRGASVAPGYFNNPEQTGKAFVQNPLNSMYPDIIYRTGDLGRYNSEGEIVFCGRKDFQIKYMGHRIELEEIEKAVTDVKEVTRACCVFDEKRSKLYGFYTGSIEAGELPEILRQKLPVYMIPSVFRQIEEFPLNKNGKTDRKQLIELYGGRRR